MKAKVSLTTSDFLNFYQQSGGGIPIFIARRQRQYGSGIGSFIFKTILPFIGKSIFPLIKKTVLPSAVNVAKKTISDIGKGESFKSAVKKRGFEAGANIAKTILGSSAKTPPPLKRRKVVKRKNIKRKVYKDIFAH
jgi:hypothetical protein